MGGLLRNITIAGLLLLAGMAVKLEWLPVQFAFQDTRWFQLILDSVIGALPAVIILDIFLKWDQIKQVNNTIVGTLAKIYGGAEQEIFSQLPDDEKRRIVRKSVVNILGEEYGSVLFDEILAPYLNREINYRDKFQYHISCDDVISDIDPNAASDDFVKDFINFTQKEHLWVSQKLGYTRFSSAETNEVPHLVARFAFSQDQLNQFIVTDELFFREIIRVPVEARKLLMGLDEQQLGRLFHAVFGLSVRSPNGKTKLKHSVHWASDDGGQKYVEVRIENPGASYQGSGCQLQFTLPHRISENEFLVTMPVPTSAGAEISFEKSPSMRRLSFIPFISSFRRKNYKVAYSPQAPDSVEGPDAITIQMTGWSFPTSGLVFVWK